MSKSAYTLEVTEPTTLKQSTAQASTLADGDVFSLSSGKYPVDAVTEKDGHIVVTFGLDASGKRVTFAGKNTWHVFGRHVKLIQNSMAAESPKQIWTPNGAIDWNDPNCRVSKFFTVLDVTRGDYRRIPNTRSVIDNILEVAKRLDEIREQWNGPIGTTSWHRPRSINRMVGGSENSFHIQGNAVDIYPMVGDIYEFQRWLDKRWNFGGLGYGADRGFCHVDLGPYRRWYY